MNHIRQKVPKQTHQHKFAQSIFDAGLADMPLIWVNYSEVNLWDDVVENWQREQIRAKHPLPWDVTQEFRDRITVNYLRHCGTNYDRVRRYFLMLPHGSRVQFLLHRLLKQRALQMIATKYPKYAKQCEVQCKEHGPRKH